MDTHITYICEKDCSSNIDFRYLFNYEFIISNYPVESGSLFCSDILIFQYTQGYDKCLSEIAHVRNTYQYKPIILVSDHFNSRLISWAITQKINNIIVLPDDLEILNNLIDDIIKDPYYSNIQHTSSINESTPAHKIRLLKNEINCKTRKAVDFIHKNFYTKINLVDSASLCNMSISTFTRTFKLEQGITFCQYLQLLRFCTAKKLLRNTSLKINQIAHMCGINDPAYFTRTFKSVEHQTPKEYRGIFR